ncbi:MAG: hypothetical protein WAN16_05665 [Chthoniobacterales bacterium]
MNSTLNHNYDPTTDQLLMSIGGIPDENGDLLDIHESLYHSQASGFYLQRVIHQARRGEIWKIAQLDENGHDGASEETRSQYEIEPLSNEQVIRYIIEVYVPEISGLKQTAHQALDGAGIGQLLRMHP